jgi:hypothetical protein
MLVVISSLISFLKENSDESDDNNQEEANKIGNNKSKKANKTIKEKIRDFVGNTNVSAQKLIYLRTPFFYSHNILF